ncbi:MAG: DUF3795 domain-containing protein [Synergistaceae bacterium]|nr:DUF3795 domain-containing protein [Synergistaceae bacterium]
MANIGCCGMDCDTCEARKATARGDVKTLARIAAERENEGHVSFILPSRLKCTGCLEPGSKSILCAGCRIRMCALENGIPHCGFCEEFPCELGSTVWDAIPEYKHNLEKLMSR